METENLGGQAGKAGGKLSGEAKVAAAAVKTAEEIAAWEATLGGRTSFVSDGGGNTIKEFSIEVVKKKWEHVYSRDHCKNGILNLGKDRPEIMNKFLDIITQADLKGLLKEGDNPILTMINSINVTVSPHIRAGKVLSFDCYVGHSNRAYDYVIKF